MDFAEQEALDGLRFTWNAWPSSRIEAARLVSVNAGCSCLSLRVSVILIPHQCLELTFDQVPKTLLVTQLLPCSLPQHASFK